MRYSEFKLTESFDPDVQADQKILKMFGYNIGPTGADGILGPATLKAIDQFNKDFDSGKLDKAKVKAAHAQLANPNSTRPASTGKIMLPVRAPVSSPFGRRASGMHLGTDFAVPVGTPVKAPQDGVVSKTGSDNMNGTFVQIDSGGTTHALLHLSKSKVTTGQQVSAGEVVGLSGNTGYSTGPHLHWSKRVAGKPVDPMNNVG